MKIIAVKCVCSLDRERAFIDHH